MSDSNHFATIRFGALPAGRKLEVKIFSYLWISQTVIHQHNLNISNNAWMSFGLEATRGQI